MINGLMFCLQVTARPAPDREREINTLVCIYLDVLCRLCSLFYILLLLFDGKATQRKDVDCPRLNLKNEKRSNCIF